MSQDKGNDLRLEDSSKDEGTVTSPKEAIEDKLIKTLYDFKEGKYGTDGLTIAKKKLQAIITTETTKARIEELEAVASRNGAQTEPGKLVAAYLRIRLEQLTDMLVTSPNTSKELPSDASSNALQKEQK